MSVWDQIEAGVASATGKSFNIDSNHGIGGGSINTAVRVSGRLGGDAVEYFIKTNHVGFGDMFAAEAEGLQEMAGSNSIRVPQVICHGEAGPQCYIVMEFLPLSAGCDACLLGEQLAAMHRVTAERYGWRRHNTIGSTPQHNTQTHDWIEFWRTQRLGYQLELAARNGYGGELQTLGQRLMADCPALFSGYTPVASMLHGDLWSGNYGGLADATPVLFDPAFYYGDREAELAMTTLFGGFSADFYAAYNNAWLLDEGYAVRRTFYNLYHIINHANLFGGGYHSQAIDMLQQILAEL